MEQYLEVTDSRSGKSYKIPIEGDYIRAADIGRIGAPEGRDEAALKAAHPLHILDNGYQHTACMESSITHMCVTIQHHIDFVFVYNTKQHIL